MPIKTKESDPYEVAEQILSDLIVALKKLYPTIEVESTKNKLATVLSEYNIQRVELGEVHPDLEDKIQLFISAKRLEGLSSITLENYFQELSMFAGIVKYPFIVFLLLPFDLR